CIENERIALLSIKAGIQRSNNPSMFSSSWIGHGCCNWKGLHHLKHLDLSMNNFKGSSIPHFIGSLANLEYLNVSNARSSGIIPHTLGNLSCLRYLDLSSYYNYQFLQENDLHWLSGMASLHHLDLSRVDLSNVHGWLHQINMLHSLLVLGLPYARLQGGGINHDTIFSHLNLTSLYLLDLSHNYDLNITLPQWLFNLTSLVYLDLSHNQIHGSKPETIVNLVHLQFLDLSETIMFGKLPKSIGNLRRLQHLRMQEWYYRAITRLKTQTHVNDICLSDIRISGDVPTWFWDLFYLSSLNISHNNLSGTLPPSIEGLFTTNLSSNKFECLIPKMEVDFLDVMGLSNNSISGPIPSFFSLVESLEVFSLANKNISGSFPLFFYNLTSLVLLNLSKKMSGGFSQCGKQTSSLEILDLSNNNLVGSIPNGIVSLPSLRSLHLERNGFSGNLPLSLKNGKQLVVLHIGENKLSGIIPSWIGSLVSLVQLLKLSSLRVLDLAQNNLSGVIFPHSFRGFIAMRTERSQLLILKYDKSLVISAKGWQTEYTKVLFLVTNIDLSCNKLSGEFFDELTSHHGLILLNLSNNLLNVKLPKNISHMNQLKSLDLSINNFSAIILPSISTLNFLGHLNLSHNKLSRKIPSGNQL
ncbi:Leucine-rich repeat protein, partial [Dioscorea alata]